MVHVSAYMSKGQNIYSKLNSLLSFTKGLYSERCLITFNLVPTPSVPQARRGSLKPAAFKSKRPAKPPRSTSQPVGEEINYFLHFDRSGEHEYTKHFIRAFPENGREHPTLKA